ncbi:MAG: glycosyltransferase family 2 protein, partial [Ardenticatenaceae bacterium]
IRSVHEGLAVVEMPIPYSERVGRSKLSIVRDGTRFLTIILWTALEYNPVRLLGTIGLFAFLVTGVIALGLAGLRLQGVTTLGPWGVFSVFSGVVLGVTGVSVFSLGATFNYLVALFHRQPVRQGLFGRPIFDPPLDRHFGWMGAVAMLIGGTVAIAGLSLSVTGWDITRLWFWLLGSALLILVGVQLTISWILMRVLEALSQRELRIQAELERHPSPQL